MKIGDRVFRKGRSLQWGVITSLFHLRNRWTGMVPDSPTHADVDWHAPNRIGGRGFHKSSLKLSALVLATEEETARRRAWLEEHRPSPRKENV